MLNHCSNLKYLYGICMILKVGIIKDPVTIYGRNIYSLIGQLFHGLHFFPVVQSSVPRIIKNKELPVTVQKINHDPVKRTTQ